MSELAQENDEETQEHEKESENSITQTDQQDSQPEQATTVNASENQDIIQKPSRENPPRLLDTFYYDAEKILAKPLTTNEKMFPLNTLSM